MTDIQTGERKQMELKEKLQALLELEGFPCRFMEPMSSHTTFRIGGPAAAYVCPSGETELKTVLSFCRREKLPFFILGNGSNLLVSDAGYEGVVISTTEGLTRLEAEGERIFASSGQLLSRTAKRALKEGLTGLEFAAGIPGTMGGGLFMNAGAYGGELKQVVTEAAVMTKDGMILHVPVEQMALGHRISSFMQTGEIILSVKMQLTQGNLDVIKETMNDFNSRRRDKQPLEYPSAGSTFKRPAGYFAGKLIEDAGLKGFSVGGAQVSKKHAGFVINTGSATAADIWNLCNEIQNRIQNEFGVTLEMEIQKLGSFDQQKTKG